MTIDAWLKAAIADAEERGLPEPEAAARRAGALDVAAARRRLQRAPTGSICPTPMTARRPGHDSRGRSSIADDQRLRKVLPRPSLFSRNPSHLTSSSSDAGCARGDYRSRDHRGVPAPHRGRQPGAERVHHGDWPTRRCSRRAKPTSELAAGTRSRPAARRADLDQGPARRPRHADHRGVARPRAATSPSATRRRDRAPAPGRRGVRRQDQPARVRVRHDQRGLGVRAGAQPARSGALAGRLERRIGGQRRRRHGARHASAPTPAARSAFPPPPAASSGSSRRSARCPPTASCRCRARSITSVRWRRPSPTRASCITR